MCYSGERALYSLTDLIITLMEQCFHFIDEYTRSQKVEILAQDGMR